MVKTIEIMDTTLRDGEQTSSVSFTATEKLTMAKFLLEDLKVDRLEVASARVSQGEFDAVKKITTWAKQHNLIHKIEVLGFVDTPVSVDWMIEAGASVLNLLCKGSLNHLKYQLKQTPEQHFTAIQKCVDYALSKGFEVNIYLEDWSNGMRNSQDYTMQMIEVISKMKVKRIMLPDTLGVLEPVETYQFCSKIVKKYPNVHFDFHAHNDYDLSVANVLGAIKAGVRAVHTTVNGLGERAGNAPLASVVAVIEDHLPGHKHNIDETKVFLASRLVESFSGLRIPANKPVVGDNVFTQTAGIHADGDSKHNLYFSDLMPERFGRKRKYALGKTSGKANISKNLEEIGIVLDAEDIQKITQHIINLGDSKETITTEDLPYIISDVLNSKSIKEKIEIVNYSLSHAHGLRPVASLKLRIDNDVYEESSCGDGQYDAFMNALKIIYTKLSKTLPNLLDYQVSIPPGGETDAFAETIITWLVGDREVKTRGLDTDQAVAAIKATMKLLNIIETY